MCGIWALFGLDHPECPTEEFKKISHRGPDAWRLEYDDRVKNCFFGFHRLSIIDGLYGMQPMKVHKYPHVILLCNGELYNYRRLQDEFGFQYETKCDVECIIHLYCKFGIEKTVKNLDGVFAFCLIDFKDNLVYLSRDPYGVRPLFRFYDDKNGILGMCSEAKGISSIASKYDCEHMLSQFPPAWIEAYNMDINGKMKFFTKILYYKPGERFHFVPIVPSSAYEIHEDGVNKLLTSACIKRLMSDKRIGCLLSGGLDSSLVAAIVNSEFKKLNLTYKLQTFSVGMDSSPDLVAAREVANFIGSEHHEVRFTENDVAEVLDDVIYHLESYDITTIRASIGMYILSKYIKENTDSTVIFSGEGADEVAQGYIYFRDAPDRSAGHQESVRLLNQIYLYDGLRADRTTSAFSLELRVPFLDIQFTQYYLRIPQDCRKPKNGIEKYLLRSAFQKSNLLPKEILWRHKEAFSDGVASVKRSLFTILQEIIDDRVTDEEYEEMAHKYNHCKPETKEAYYYRKTFDKFYPHLQHFTPYYWMPKWTEATDPSARFIKHYAADK